MDSALGSDNATQRIATKAARLNIGTTVYPFEDVTQLLDTATKDMKVGELIQVGSFSLFDAMCAIVIMDPKMDTGMILDDYASRPQYDVNQPLNPKEFIWIIDNILVGQMTWLSGHALSQTLFTSCYILRALEIEESQDGQNSSQHAFHFVQLVLKPCVLAIAKSCALIWSEMRKGQVYEEEDFMTNKFGVSLYENFPISTLIAMLDQAEVWLESEGKQWINVNHVDDEASQVCKGIMDRVHYVRSSFLAFYQVVAPKCSQFLPAVTQLEVVREHIKGIKATYALGTEVQGAFDHAVHRKLVTNTPPRAIALLSATESFDQLDQMCADLMTVGQALYFPNPTSLLNFFIQFGAQKPAPGAFPRSILQTVLYEDRLIMGTQRVEYVLRDIIQETVTPVPWVFENFDAHQELLQESVTQSGLESIPEVVEDEISATKRQIQIKVVMLIEKATKPFVDTLQIMGQNVARQRRNLRKIVQLWETLQEESEALDEQLHLAMDEFKMLMGLREDESKEPPMRPFYFVSWVYHMKLWVMEWMLLLGSELELYSSFEFSMIFGYCDHVFGAHTQHLRRVNVVVDNDAEAAAAAIRNLGSTDGTQKKKKKKKKKAGSTASLPSANSASSSTASLSSSPKSPALTSATPRIPASTPPVPPSPETSTPTLIPVVRVQQSLATIRLQLVRGTFLVLAALTKAGHLSTEPPHLAMHGLNDLETLFGHRFKAFHHLSSPEPLTYEGFLHRLDCEGLAAMEIFDYAADFFNEAKVSLDNLQTLTAREARVEMCEDAWRKDIKNTIRACIASKIAIASLKKDARVMELYKRKSSKPQMASAQALRAPVRKVVFEWKYHLWWPVITLASP